MIRSILVLIALLIAIPATAAECGRLRCPVPDQAKPDQAKPDQVKADKARRTPFRTVAVKVKNRHQLRLRRH